MTKLKLKWNYHFHISFRTFGFMNIDMKLKWNPTGEWITWNCYWFLGLRAELMTWKIDHWLGHLFWQLKRRQLSLGSTPQTPLSLLLSLLTASHLSYTKIEHPNTIFSHITQLSKIQRINELTKKERKWNPLPGWIFEVVWLVSACDGSNKSERLSFGFSGKCKSAGQ